MINLGQCCTYRIIRKMYDIIKINNYNALKKKVNEITFGW